MEEKKFDLQNLNTLKVKGPVPVKKGHVCSICQKWFKRSSDLRRHGSVHSSERPISCDHCNLKFKTKDRLYQHRRYLSLVASHVCEYCKKRFKSKASLSYHLRLHTKEKPYHCEMCNKSFTLKAYLEYHYGSRTYLEHHRKFEEFKEFEYLVEKYKPVVSNCLYTCIVCNKQYKTAQSLRVHSKIHTDEKCECDICGFRVSKRNFQNHKLAAHSDNRKRYFCSNCQKSFTTKYRLKLHKAIKHEQVKPLKCETCSRSFLQKSLLSKHIRVIHNEEKNYVCVMCDKRYATMHGLRYHMRNHTGERPYVCHICDKGFKGSSDLNRHLKACEKKKNILKSQKSEDSNMALTVPKNESTNIKIGLVTPEKTLTQENVSQSLTKNLPATKPSFNKRNNVFVSKNVKIIKVQNTVELDALRAIKIFRMYR